VRGLPDFTRRRSARTLARVRSLSPVEAALSVAIVGSVLAVMVPTIARNLRASRMAEPIDGLNRVAMAASSMAASRPAFMAYPAGVSLTPAQVPRGEPRVDPAGTWDHPTWRMLGLSFTAAHYYSFEFLSRNEPDGAVFEARAHGDLDGDGVLSTFEIAGESKDGKEPVIFPLESHREVE
jgi:hypothetical protein